MLPLESYFQYAHLYSNDYVIPIKDNKYHPLVAIHGMFWIIRERRGTGITASPITGHHVEHFNDIEDRFLLVSTTKEPSPDYLYAAWNTRTRLYGYAIWYGGEGDAAALDWGGGEIRRNTINPDLLFLRLQNQEQTLEFQNLMLKR